MADGNVFTADASEYFMSQLLALEPGTANSGIYADKPGYHNTRNQNDPDDYSVRDAEDQEGSGDLAAAYDWTHWAAQSGDYRSMAKYGDRLEAAFNARDPRLAGWREAQGQTDTDKTPESMDFRYWRLGTPSSSHAWHWHFSEDRGYVESYDNKNAMLSILRGESLADYLAAGGKLMGDDMSWEQPLTAGADAGGGTYPAKDWLIGANWKAWDAWENTEAIKAELATMTTLMQQMLDLLMGAGSPDAAAILAGVEAKLTEQRQYIAATAEAHRKRIEDAVADLGEGGAAKVRAEIDSNQ